MDMDDVEVPVLVIGGSLVGLSTSLFLAHHGVPHLVVERHRGTAIHPRAAFLMQRTVELFRSAGIEGEVVAAAEREFVQNGAIMAVEQGWRGGRGAMDTPARRRAASAMEPSAVNRTAQPPPYPAGRREIDKA